MIELKAKNTIDLNAPVRHITAKAELLCSSSAEATKNGANLVYIDNAHPTPHNIEIKADAGTEVLRFGKNLITYPYYQSSGLNYGINFTVNDDGTITATGTATTRLVFYLTVVLNKTDVFIPAGVQATLSGVPTSGVVSGRAFLQGTNGSVYPSDFGGGITFTSTGSRYRFYIVVEEGTVLDNAVFKPQCEIGSTATAYEPYKGFVSAVANSEGVIDSIPSLSPTMTVIASTDANLSVSYNTMVEGDNRVFTHDGDLKEITIDRVGDNTKFFGYGISQKVNVKVRDVARQYSITTNNFFRISFDGAAPFPFFYITETHRDETTNELSITAYDKLYEAAKHTFSELEFSTKYYNCGEVGAKCAQLLGLTINFTVEDESITHYYMDGANFDGTETIREVLDDIAEATQTIYYCSETELIFKRLNIAGEPVLTIDKSLYFELDSKDNRRLNAVCSATELGDNVIAEMDYTGTTQYIRDNAFWEVREDIDTVVADALAVVAGLTVNQFSCSWRGNYLLELCDKIAFITKNNKQVEAYFVNDKLVYDGSFSQTTEWALDSNDAESADNPATLGEALKKTFAKVDKVNKEITLLASETSNNTEKIAQLQIDTSGISARVSELEETTTAGLNGLTDDVAHLKHEVETAITSEDVSIQIRQELDNGVNKVITSTGFVFDEGGLNISKSGSEMTTNINEDGMRVLKNNKEVLTADNTGVKAVNLHATTYLIVGDNSRFENYGSNRTGCFWIGG